MQDIDCVNDHPPVFSKRYSSSFGKYNDRDGNVRYVSQTTLENLIIRRYEIIIDLMDSTPAGRYKKNSPTIKSVQDTSRNLCSK